MGSVNDHTRVFDLVAEPLHKLSVDIEKNKYSKSDITPSLIQDFHYKICATVTPDVAGKFRTVDVMVGGHTPVGHKLVNKTIWEYSYTLQDKINYTSIKNSTVTVDTDLEFLAFAEAELLYIHPFTDFNGRTTRVFVQFLCKQINFPLCDMTNPQDSGAVQSYFAALREYDLSKSVKPLCLHWEKYRL